MDKARLAQWWCLLNGWEWPDELGRPLVQSSERDAIMGAFSVVNHLAYDAGISLWERRHNEGLDPATGKTKEQIADQPDPGVKSRK